MKLGFCFLCQNDIHQLSLWEKFFENNYDKCNIYVHCYEQDKVTQAFVKKYHIDKVIPTQWGDIYEVIRYIMNLSIANDDYKLILLSESTIPVKPFSYIYHYLTYDEKGFLHFIPHLSRNENEKYCLLMQYKRYLNNIQKIQDFTTKVDISHWFHNETWIIFNQEMMNIITDDTIYFPYFKESFVYDENYPMYLYSFYNKLHLFHNIKTTYTSWKGTIEGKRHPKTYDKIDENIIHYLMNPNLLFARKFTRTSNVELYISNIYDGYHTEPKFIADKCLKIFTEAVTDISLPSNTVFTYLSINELQKYPLCNNVFRLLSNDTIRILDDKKDMNSLINDDTITPRIYTSVQEIMKDYQEPDKLWFLKYRFGCSGKHILCKTTNDLHSIEISERFIIQEAILDLDLYQGYKYTLRIFILIHNKQLYVYSGAKKRVHNVKYDKLSSDYSVHVGGGDYSERIPFYYDKDDITYMKIKETLKRLQPKIQRIILETDRFNYSLVGLDYLVKSNGNVIMIEMNPHPQIMRNPENVNKIINIPLMKDTVNLVAHNKIHNYELI